MSCFICLFSVYADRKDSLEKLLLNPVDTSTVGTLIRLSQIVYDTDKKRSAVYASRALRVSDSLDFDRGKVYSLNMVGLHQIVDGNYDEAIITYSKALSIRSPGISKETSKQLTTRLAAAYYYTGDYSNAINQYNSLVDLATETNDDDMLFLGLNGIGNVYYSQKKTDDALGYYQKAFKNAQTTQDTTNMITVLVNIGNCYSSNNNLRSALDCFFKVIDLEESKKGHVDRLNIASSYINIGAAYFVVDSFATAEKNYSIAVNISHQNGYKVKELTALIGQANCLVHLKQFDRAQRDLESALIFAGEINRPDLIVSVYENLSEVCFQKGDYKMGYTYEKLYAQKNDSLVRKQYEESTAKQQTIMKTKEKEEEINRLNIEGKVKDTERNFMIALSVLGLVVTFFVYRSYREKKQANKDLGEKNTAIRKQKREIESQKSIVDIQNKEITDSINYAKQIQTAILPSNEVIKKMLPQSFVLYKPKAIVSGDFYFFTEKENKIILAAVDCTGHGVPGAFMSMIGHNLLNQIIIESGITKPSEILDQLHLGVRKVLQQDDSSTGNRDGMDIALVAIDKKMKTLEYAGANRPLYYVRNSALNEVKSDKFPIGGFQNEEERKFTNNIVDLQKNDVVYLFSDGYADQFGGAHGKKFMVKNLKNSLLEISKLKVMDQQSELNKLFENWRGGTEQVDDVLVVGIKI